MEKPLVYFGKPVTATIHSFARTIALHQSMQIATGYRFHIPLTPKTPIVDMRMAKNRPKYEKKT
jgi:hypothetical protein